MISIVDKGFFNCFISIDIIVLSPPVTGDDPVPRLWLWPRAGCGGEVPGPANSRLGQALAQPQLPRLAAGQALALALGGAARHAGAGARNIVTVSHPLPLHCHRTGSVFHIWTSLINHLQNWAPVQMQGEDG